MLRRKIISEKAIYRPCRIGDGAVRVLSPTARMLAVRFHGTKQSNSSFVRVMSRCSPSTATKSGTSSRSMDDLETKVEDGVLKVRYQYFRQLIPTKEVLS